MSDHALEIRFENCACKFIRLEPTLGNGQDRGLSQRHEREEDCR